MPSPTWKMTTIDPFERLSRARAAAGDHPDLRWVLDTIDAWAAHAVADGRQRPLQRYLGMGTPAQMKRYLRDRALIETSTHLGVSGGPFVLAQELERAWHRFRGVPGMGDRYRTAARAPARAGQRTAARAVVGNEVLGRPVARRAAVVQHP